MSVPVDCLHVISQFVPDAKTIYILQKIPIFKEIYDCAESILCDYSLPNDTELLPHNGDNSVVFPSEHKVCIRRLYIDCEKYMGTIYKDIFRLTHRNLNVRNWFVQNTINFIPDINGVFLGYNECQLIHVLFKGTYTRVYIIYFKHIDNKNINLAHRLFDDSAKFIFSHRVTIEMMYDHLGFITCYWRMSGGIGRELRERIHSGIDYTIIYGGEGDLTVKKMKSILDACVNARIVTFTRPLEYTLTEECQELLKDFRHTF